MSLSRFFIPFATLAIYISLCITSCQMYDFSVSDTPEGNGGVSGKTSSVRIITRSSQDDADIYPLYVYAFNTAGELIAQQHLTSPTDDLCLKLPQKSECHIIAVSADETIYNLPTNPTPTSVITLKHPSLGAGATDFERTIAQGYSTSHPLQIGSATVFPTSDSANCNIQLNYQVASLSVNLTNLPDSCSNVYLTIASPYNSISFSGVGEGSQTARIPLTASASTTRSEAVGASVSSSFYVFPTATTTTFTISYTDAQGDHSASVNYLAPLKAGVPYILNGAYDDGSIHVTGSFTPSAWASPVSLDFDFMSDSSITIGASEGDNDIIDDTNVYTVTSIPEPLSLWNGHVVVAVDSISKPATLLLLSLTDWGNMTSATSVDKPTDAFTIAKGYTEYEFNSAWRIPTIDEAAYLSFLYMSNTSTFNSLLESAEADPIHLTDSSGKNLRYLCDGAKATYSFKNDNILTAGSSVKNYRLRLVRSVQVKVEDSSYL